MPVSVVRPLRAADLVDAGTVAAAALGSDPSWVARSEHLLGGDPAGCWVAEEGGRLVGVAMSLRRDTTWVLALLAVHPQAQGRGTGRALLEAALASSRGCLRGLGLLPDDPRAVRRLRLAGFALHPTYALAGVPDLAAPVDPPGRTRVGGPGDRDLLDSVDRQVRAAAHGADQDLVGAGGELLVSDAPGGSGYAWHRGGTPALLAATSTAAASRLLWACLTRAPRGQPVRVGHLSAAQEWALDVGLAVGLKARPDGWLAVRNGRPPVAYVPAEWFC